MAQNEEKIACHACKTMIPKATALNAEGEGYVLHFCSIECLDYWKKEKEKQGKEQESDD
jgi:YHS domain-containing protein